MKQLLVNMFAWVLVAVYSVGATICLAKSDTNFVIRGKVEGVSNQKVYLKQLLTGSRAYQDFLVAEVIDGKFEFKGSLPNPPAILGIQFEDRSISSRDNFYAENTEMTVEMRLKSKQGNKMSLATIVEGSFSEDERQAFELTEQRYRAQLRDIQESIKALNIDPKVSRDQLASETLETLDKLSNQSHQLRLEYLARLKRLVREEGDKLSGALAMYRMDMGMAGQNPFSSEQEREELKAGLSAELQASQLGQMLNFWQESANRKKQLKAELSAGNLYKDFTQSDVDGNLVTVSKLLKPGHFLLVDFWAAWCAPCRAENPNVLKAYETFHKKGFDVLAVSLDADKESWLDAIEEDGMPWIHVSDLKGWQNSAAQLYGIDAIPTNILLDGNGMIVGVNLKGAILHEKLTELLGGV